MHGVEWCMVWNGATGDSFGLVLCGVWNEYMSVAGQVYEV